MTLKFIGVRLTTEYIYFQSKFNACDGLANQINQCFIELFPKLLLLFCSDSLGVVNKVWQKFNRLNESLVWNLYNYQLGL